MQLLVLVLRRATTAVVLLMLTGVVIVVTDAQANEVVLALRDAAAWLAAPFDGAVGIDDPRAAVALNWSLAAAAYGLAGGFLGRRLVSFERRSRQRSPAGHPPSGALLMM